MQPNSSKKFCCGFRPSHYNYKWLFYCSFALSCISLVHMVTSANCVNNPKHHKMTQSYLLKVLYMLFHHTSFNKHKCSYIVTYHQSLQSPYAVPKLITLPFCATHPLGSTIFIAQRIKQQQCNYLCK